MITTARTVTDVRLAIWAGNVKQATEWAAYGLDLLAMGWAPPAGWSLSMWKGFLEVAPDAARVQQRAEYNR